MKNIILIFLLAIGFSTTIQSITVLEFCKANPNHKSVNIINQIFDQAQPRIAILRWVRLIIGKDKLEYNPSDLVNVFLINSTQDIGNELGWDKKKINEEFDALLVELKRIQNS